MFLGSGSSRMCGFPSDSSSISSCIRVCSLGPASLTKHLIESSICYSTEWRFLFWIWLASMALVTISSALNYTSFVKVSKASSIFSRSSALRRSIANFFCSRCCRKLYNTREQDVMPMSEPAWLSDRPNSVIASRSSFCSREISLLDY